MKWYVGFALLLFMSPSICLARVWGSGIEKGYDESYDIVQEDPNYKSATVVPQGISISISGGGDVIGSPEWVWLAVQKLPDGKLMFIAPDGRLSEKPVPFCEITGWLFDQFSFETPRLAITSSIPEGSYRIYALCTWWFSNVYDRSLWDGEPLSNLIFIRRELNRQEWESQGWAIRHGPGI
jgi:hypothetical protein